MAIHPDYPGISSFTDRHGTIRWRFRAGRRSVSLPLPPGHVDFSALYAAASTGMPLPTARPAASIHRISGAALPRSMRAAWLAYKAKSPEWAILATVSRIRKNERAERFLLAPVDGVSGPCWGDQPVADFMRRHVKLVLSQRAATPHAAKNLLVVIRNLVEGALDEEWIEQDPTFRVRWSPKLKGHRPWRFEQLLAFETRWPVGTTARLAYAIALWLGNRRSDVVSLRPEDLREQVADITQGKTGHAISVPVVWMLEEVLAATDLTGATVLKTIHGRPFSPKSLTGRMQQWTAAAGLPPGCTLHGLRKTLGAIAADAEATTREGMSILGHTSVDQYENYSRSADQKRLAASGMAKVVTLWEERLKRAG